MKRSTLIAAIGGALGGIGLAAEPFIVWFPCMVVSGVICGCLLAAGDFR